MPARREKLVTLPGHQRREIFRAGGTECDGLRAKVLLALPREPAHLLEVSGIEIALLLEPSRKSTAQVRYRRPLARTQLYTARNVRLSPSRERICAYPDLRQRTAQHPDAITRCDRPVDITHRGAQGTRQPGS